MFIQKYPSATNSALDGYAIRSSDTKNLNYKKGKLFKIIGTFAAGDKPFNKKNGRYQALEIMTGSVVPKNFDAIIPNEQMIYYPSKKKPKYIFINKKIKKNLNIRFKGSDYKKKDLVIRRGTILQSSHILSLKTLGIDKIKVKKLPNILFFSTGNEISNKKKIPKWKIRNSNNYYIKSLEKNFLFNLRDGGILKDKDELILYKKIKRMFNSSTNILITCGAVSKGKYDYVPKIIKKFKLSKYFKSVAIKPGKPILFAKIKKKQKVIFGLPGNPISSAVGMRFFVYPYILILMDIDKEKPIKARLKNSFNKKFFFTNFLRAKISTTNNGNNEVEILKGQESYRIKSLVKSNIWVILPSGKSKFKKGDIVDCFFSNYPN